MLNRTLVFALAGGQLLAIGCSEPDTTAPPPALTTGPAFNLTTPIYPVGMISYWKLDEGSGAIAYDARAANDGTVHGAQWTTGQVDQALAFDRTALKYVQVPHDPSLNTTSALSVEAWLNWQPEYDGWDFGIVIKETNYCQYGYGFRLINGVLGLMIHDGVQHQWSCGPYVMADEKFPGDGRWHHAAAVYSDPHDQIRLYIDGQLVKESTSFTTQLHNTGNTSHLSIGAWIASYANDPHYSHVWQGMIDEVAIYDRALTPGEIQQHYLAGLSGHGYELSVLPVDIDIKPGSDPNSINCYNWEEVITVAILTTDAFDARTVDHTSVAFEGAGETHVSSKTYEARRHEEDVDGDGDTDLVLHFRRGETSLTCDSTDGALTGVTYDGVSIEGSDAVRMIF